MGKFYEKYVKWWYSHLTQLWLVIVAVIAINMGIGTVTTAEGIEILLLLTLVLVTWSYARDTRNISKSSQEAAEAATEEAKASTRAAEEMRESKFASLKPIIVMGRTIAYGVVRDARQISEQTTIGDRTWLYNVGPGPALNLRFFLKEPSRRNPAVVFEGKRLSALGPGEAYELMLASISGEKRQSRYDLTVEYEDIFGWKWCSGLEVDYDSQGDQFTVLNLFYEKLD